jgi:hypothetical protein
MRALPPHIADPGADLPPNNDKATRVGTVRVPTLYALEAIGDRVERIAEVGADRPQDGDCRNCNQRRDQTVLDRRNAAFILDQARDYAQPL